MKKQELRYILDNPAIADQDEILIDVNGETVDFYISDPQRFGNYKTFPKEIHIVPYDDLVIEKRLIE